MLFTSAVFVLLFLPVTWAGFFVLGRWKHTAGLAWLCLASLFFYGWWMPEFTALLLLSIGVNFNLGRRISELAHSTTPAAAVHSKRWLMAGVALNMGLLGYYKYANFFIDNLNFATGLGADIGKVTLPIGISFYTFTQIAFLVDCHRAKVHEYSIIPYGLFVTYFPHLIAGPVLHHGQMMPQFAERSVFTPNRARLVAGLAIFAGGLFKKIVLADGAAPYADAVFKGADAGMLPATEEGWLGAVAYTLQLYFDFSGYSDMAIGLSLMFNIQLPYNFNSPYRATNISEFWRRWHISLSTFLRDYLYISLGGNRRGPTQQQLNLMTTMVLGGLWHGASWSFVIWGALHGIYLVINHTYRRMLGTERQERWGRWRPYQLLSWGATLLAVVVAWVFFRAESLHGALLMLQSMGAVTGSPPLAESNLLWNGGLSVQRGWLWCAALGVVAVLAPNSNVLGERFLAWCHKANRGVSFCGALAVGAILFLVLVNTARDSTSAFIYFNF